MTSILICGDYSPMNRATELIAAGRPEEAFGDFTELNRRMDYSVVNFETTVADSDSRPIPKYGPNLRCCPADAEAPARAGFDMVTLANNHFRDFGDRGVDLSLAAIDRAGLARVGGGRNLAEAAQTVTVGVNGLKVAFVNCCEHEFTIATPTSSGANPLDPVGQYNAIGRARAGGADRVIVIVHGGHEHYQLPSPRMVSTYRFFIDAGADAVVNHHQHCVSGYEFHRGRPIVYGLGNFCFDRGPGYTPYWSTGYAAELRFDGEETSLEIHPYEQYGTHAGIRLLRGAEREAFMSKIDELNRIIADPEAVAAHAAEFYDGNSRFMLSIFEPYIGRIPLGLRARHLLPSFLTRRRRLQAINYLNCESHLDRLRHILRKSQDNA